MESSENHHPIIIVRKLSESKPHTFLAWDTVTNQFFPTNILRHDQEAPRRSPKGTKPLLLAPKFKVQNHSSSLKCNSLFDIIVTKNIRLDIISSRTYFNQIIANLEAIHSQGAAYMNLKLSSLVLDEEFMLKLASDFDQKVCWEEDLGCQAPEVLEGVCMDRQKADIYSLGMILFLLKTGGHLPYDKNGFYDGVDMRDLLKKNQNKFWQMQCKRFNKKATFFCFDFRKLFMKMTDLDMSNRPSLEEIKGSVWCAKKTHSRDELFAAMKAQIEESAEEIECEC